MARNVSDARLLFEVLAGYDDRDPFSAPVPLQVLGFGHELLCDSVLLARRYGLADGGAVLVRPDGHVAWTCAEAVEPVAQLLTALDLTLGRACDRALAVPA